MLALISLFGLAIAGMAFVPTPRTQADDDDVLPEDEDDRGPDEDAEEETGPAGQAIQYPDDADFGDNFGDDSDGDLGPDPLDPTHDDSLTGTEGRDDIRAGDGDDVVSGLGNNDYLDGEDGNDNLAGDVGRDELHGGAGDDLLDGGDDNDSLFGHVGDDSLDGGTGEDELNGGDGTDVMDGGAGNDSLLGSFGADVLRGGAGVDMLNGGDGNDYIDGSEDGDVVQGDYLNGGTGDDVLIGGAFDNMNGGEGEDMFSIDSTEAAQGVARIEDFDAAEDALVLVYDGTGPEPELSMSVSAEGTSLLADGQEVAFVAGVQTIDLSEVQLIAA
jgi:Ca2+-binding RTX toxin-like protein